MRIAAILVLSVVLRAQSADVLRAEPYPRMGDPKLLSQQGYYQLVYEKLGEIPIARISLPVPGSTWKLTGRVGRLENGTIVAGFGTYLFWSRDEGRTWDSRRIENLPGTREPVNVRAFGVSRDAVFAAHERTADPPLPVSDRTIHPVTISRSSDLGKSWTGAGALPIPQPYTFLAGDGNHIVELGDGTILAALDAANDRVKHFERGWLAQIFYRSQDGGRTWGDASVLPDRAAEVGLLSRGGLRLLAACRGMSNPNLGGKTIQLAESEDGGRTWRNRRQLTWVFGQAHGDLATIPGGGVVAVYENRYPEKDADVRARVSWDGGVNWEPEVYRLARGIGYAGSVASPDGTIITVTGDGERQRGKPAGRGYTLTAIRWKPWPPAKNRQYLDLADRN